MQLLQRRLLIAMLFCILTKSPGVGVTISITMGATYPLSISPSH